jgi:ABC-type cobalamin/Fe3+-siderophores transport system ATPase subunit
VLAVDSVTLSVERGELFGLLGPNGAGKATLIKLLCTLVVPTSGEALVNGFNLVDGESIRRHVGGVFYPIAVLPTWLQPLSHLLPLTYSLSAMRRAILQGDSLSALAPDIVMLGMFAAVLLPLRLVAFQNAVRRAEIEGSLTQY